MTSKDLWDLLERLSEKDIMTMIILSTRYLEKSRNIKIKDTLKEIRKANKYLEV